MTDKEFLLHVLKDGKPHTQNEILLRSIRERGCGLTVHSRASDLREDGFDIANFRVLGQTRGNGSCYQLRATDTRSDEPHRPDGGGATPSAPPPALFDMPTKPEWA